jgi:hypothetical protein
MILGQTFAEILLESLLVLVKLVLIVHGFFSFLTPVALHFKGMPLSIYTLQHANKTNV